MKRWDAFDFVFRVCAVYIWCVENVRGVGLRSLRVIAERDSIKFSDMIHDNLPYGLNVTRYQIEEVLGASEMGRPVIGVYPFR